MLGPLEEGDAGEGDCGAEVEAAGGVLVQERGGEEDAPDRGEVAVEADEHRAGSLEHDEEHQDRQGRGEQAQAGHVEPVDGPGRDREGGLEGEGEGPEHDGAVEHRHPGGRAGGEAAHELLAEHAVEGVGEEPAGDEPDAQGGGALVDQLGGADRQDQARDADGGADPDRPPHLPRQRGQGRHDHGRDRHDADQEGRQVGVDPAFAQRDAAPREDRPDQREQGHAAQRPEHRTQRLTRRDAEQQDRRRPQGPPPRRDHQRREHAFEQLHPEVPQREPERHDQQQHDVDEHPHPSRILSGSAQRGVSPGRTSCGNRGSPRRTRSDDHEAKPVRLTRGAGAGAFVNAGLGRTALTSSTAAGKRLIMLLR